MKVGNHKVRTALWVSSGGLEAAKLYTSLLPDSSYEVVMGEGDDDPMLVTLTLAGAPFQVMTYPTDVTLTEAVSISVMTEDQAETDRMWDALTEGGEEKPCGWLTDRFGVSWQIVPRQLMELQSGDNHSRGERVRQAMFKMKKIDIAALEAAANET